VFRAPLLDVEIVRNGVRATNPRAFMQAAITIYDTASPHYTEVAAKVAAPVLIIQGAEDLIAPLEGARRLQQALPNARLEVLDGVGHVPELEAPERVNRLIADFLAP
jgi:3-oxoadipate enol-lactonase